MTLQEPKSTPGALQSLLRQLFAPIDVAPLVYLRVCFGLLAVWLMWIFYSAGAIETHYIIPKLHFKYYGFEWVKPWPGNGMYWHFAGLTVAAACIAAGLLTRTACVLFGVGFGYVFLLEQARYMNHFYLLVLVSFLLAAVPANRAFSIDAWLRPGIRTATAPAWCLWLFRIQMGIVYFYAGVSKFDADWLQGAPLALMVADHTDLPLVGQYFHEQWMILAMSYGALVFDLFAFPLLLWRPTRVPVLVVAAVFHLMNSQIFNIDIFPWFSLGFTVILFFSRLAALPSRRRRNDRAEACRTTGAAGSAAEADDCPGRLVPVGSSARPAAVFAVSGERKLDKRGQPLRVADAVAAQGGLPLLVRGHIP